MIATRSPTQTIDLKGLADALRTAQADEALLFRIFTCLDPEGLPQGREGWAECIRLLKNRFGFIEEK